MRSGVFLVSAACGPGSAITKADGLSLTPLLLVLLRESVPGATAAGPARRLASTSRAPRAEGT